MPCDSTRRGAELELGPFDLEMGDFIRYFQNRPILSTENRLFSRLSLEVDS